MKFYWEYFVALCLLVLLIYLVVLFWCADKPDVLHFNQVFGDRGWHTGIEIIDTLFFTGK